MLSQICVAQEYLQNPLLIEGLKFDMRVYVMISSVNPMRAYVFPDGLIRLCTQAYQPPSKDNANNVTMHLTNYALNKKSFMFNEPTEYTKMDRQFSSVATSKDDTSNSGSKRSIKWFRSWIRKQGKDDVYMWRRVCEVCTRTLLLAQPKLQERLSPNDELCEKVKIYFSMV